MFYKSRYQYIFYVLILLLSGCSKAPHTDIVHDPQTNLNKYVLKLNKLESRSGKTIEFRLRYVEKMDYILGDIIIWTNAAKYAFNSSPKIWLVINGKKHLLRFLFSNNKQRVHATTTPIYAGGFWINNTHTQIATALENTVILSPNLLKKLFSKGAHKLYVETGPANKLQVYGFEDKNIKAIKDFLGQIPIKKDN